MKSRGKVLLTLTTVFVAAAVMIMPVLAEETFVVITHLAPESQKVTFLTKGGETMELAVTESTEVVDGKGDKSTLKDVADAVSQAIMDGKKGLFAKLTYEKTVISKLSVGLIEKKKAK